MLIGQSTKLNLLLPSLVAFPPLASKKLLKRRAAKSPLALLKVKDNSIAEGKS
jgi:hypothetical protein